MSKKPVLYSDYASFGPWNFCIILPFLYKRTKISDLARQSSEWRFQVPEEKMNAEMLQNPFILVLNYQDIFEFHQVQIWMPFGFPKPAIPIAWMNHRKGH
jgi:hypothetical protein